ncbi:MAG: hypothetical protein NC311_08985 [Muribaculaceae bacterium]|nr:hypothetical protein [Muribaculaceae bacterium]
MSGIRNADITIYHRTWDAANRRDVWMPAQYTEASWYAHTGAESGSSGETAADGAVVRIYTTDALEIGIGDMLVPQLTDVTMASSAEIKQLFPDSVKVLKIRDNRRGSPALRHWRLEGA